MPCSLKRIGAGDNINVSVYMEERMWCKGAAFNIFWDVLAFPRKKRNITKVKDFNKYTYMSMFFQ